MNNLEKAFDLFDTYNRRDPNQVVWNDTMFPATLFYALKLHEWITVLSADASEALLLASRCQHIGRWMSARTSYPEGKAGYLQWRADLAKFHASKAAELMTAAGYGEESLEHVQRIILKKNPRTDPEVQTMENALCLVFLQYQFEEFIQKHDEKKVIRIIQKSWGKMSEPGREAALTISYSDRGKQLLEKALA